MEFKRESRHGKVIYFDVELVRGSPSFLKLLQRCHSLAQVSPYPLSYCSRASYYHFAEHAVMQSR